MEFVFHNPPRRKRTKAAKKARRAVRRVSAKQRANWARFARMAKARAGKRARRSTRRKSKHRARPIVAERSTRRATTMPRIRRSRRRGGRSRAGSFARGFTLNPRQFLKKDILMEAGGVAVATIAIPKLIEKLAFDATTHQPKQFMRGADGQLSPTKYMVAKLVAGLGLAFAAHKFKQPTVAKGLLVGALAMTAYDLAIRSNPQLAPGARAAGVAGDYYLPDAPPTLQMTA